MALQSDPTHLGDIGDEEPDEGPAPDWAYEREMGQRRERRE